MGRRPLPYRCADIEAALAKHGGHQGKAARELGVSRSYLSLTMLELGLRERRGDDKDLQARDAEVLRLRARGFTWDDVGHILGITASGALARHKRAMDRKKRSAARKEAGHGDGK